MRIPEKYLPVSLLAIALLFIMAFRLSAQSASPPVASYHFNEGTGLYVTDTSGNNTGTISGASWSASGKYEGALAFDGTNDLVTIADAPDLDFTDGMTLEAWVRPASLNGWNTVILKEAPSGLAYSLYANGSAQRPATYVHTAGAGDISAVGGSQLPLNNWSHLAGTYDGSSINTYINGNLVGTTNVSGNITTSSNSLSIGGNSVWGEHFNGLIDEVRIYDRALNASEIQADMNTPVTSGLPDFSYEILNLVKTVAPSGSTFFELEVNYLDGFTTSAIDLWVTGLPENVTARYAFNPMSHQGRTEMLVTTTDTTPGTYTLIMGATSGTITHSEEVTLIISETADFILEASPSTKSVVVGDSTSFVISLDEINDFIDPVVLSVSNLPSGISASFSPQSPVPIAATELTITTSLSATPDTYNLTVEGTSGSLSHTAPITLIVAPQNAAWVVSTIGTTGVPNNTVRVGKVRTDGLNRVYIGTIDTGRMLEYAWNGSAWTGPVDVGGSLTNQEIHNVTIGKGRGDNQERIYAASYDNNVYEIWHDGTSWQQQTVASLDGLGMHAAVGDGRGDGVTRLYLVSTQSLYEYTWNGNSWIGGRIGPTPGSHGVTVGEGRSDGSTSVFVASVSSGTYEARYNGSWSITSMGDSGDARDVEVGDGRNDGVNRVYVPMYDGRLRELSWNGSSWEIVHSTVPGGSLIHAYVIPGRNDGLNRIYASSSDGKSYEFTWNGTSWSSLNMGGGNDYMYGQHFGNGRNDGVTRFYSADRGSVNRVYEYYWSGSSAQAGQSLSLSRGWHIISLNVQPDNEAVSAVLGDIEAQVELLKNAQGEVYWPALGIDQIGDWKAEDGYKIYMKSGAALEVTGAKIDPKTTPITLELGWNMVAYLRDSTMDVDVALADIIGDIILVKDEEGRVFWPALGITNDLTQLVPGKGYKIYVANPTELIYPDN